VEVNCNKALSICLSEDSPYRNFNGAFPSGTNWEDYLLWIRKEMRSLSTKVTVTVLVDDTGSSNNDQEIDNVLPDDGGDNNKADEVDDDYFKSYFAFTLWGYIPPEGGETYKSTLMKPVINIPSKSKKNNTRIVVNKDEVEEKEYLRKLEARGTATSSRYEVERLGKITTLMTNGRK